MTLRNVAIDDKYTLDSGRLYMTGNQALVRLPMLQRQRDRAAGLNTAGYISGYRGSPIGTYDMELERSTEYLQENDIVFQPGINEDLAATAVWGTQQLEVEDDRQYDGVFAIWYGKGPGVFRSGDAIKHGSFYGASPHGGVLLIPGDDHTAKSSTIAHFSDPEMIAHGSPILYPATIQEVIDYGLIGWALSRYSGAWVTLKTVNETIEGTGTVDLDLSRSETRNPEGLAVPPEAHFVPPTGGLGPAQTAEQMAYSGRVRLVKAFARLNRLDRCTIEAPRKRLGIVASGKVHQDVLRALQLLGIDREQAEALGISLYKVAMPWPLEDESFGEFARGHEEILVIEEKLPLMEQQITRMLFNWPAETRPRVIGKEDEQGNTLQRSYGAVDPNYLVTVIGSRLAANAMLDGDIAAAIRRSRARVEGKRGAVVGEVVRMPYYCSGCPHNRSTVVPEGSKALGGIGCHGMAAFMNRNTTFPCQMGGEGHNWVGLSHFVSSPHRFQNLGDGTYTHSGLHAVHAAVAAGVNITYKILYNDAVAMTGGQATEGSLTPQQISRQVVALGARRVVVTTDEPEKYRGQPPFADGVTVHHRDELDRLQRELREIKGVTVLINDQTCAAEKRRRRKRGQFPDPDKRFFINELVCEACGDCSVQSNCVSLQARETEFGNKRYVDQSTCNKDYSCVQGFCPSFVTVYGGRLRKAEAAALGEDLFDGLPTPSLPDFEHSYAILINGIGGTGVVTIGAVLGMAAHLEDKSISIYDMTGFAQKGGAVQSHLRIGEKQADITSIPIGPGDADLILGCDLVVTAGESSMRAIEPGRTRAVVNSDPVATAALQLMRDFEVPASVMARGIRNALGDDVALVDATKIAYALTGNSIASNMFLVGYAFQQGWLPLSEAAILKAIEINGVSVDFNRNAFRLGRVAAHDMGRLEPLIADYLQSVRPDLAATPEEALQRRLDYLTDYQDAAWAARYRELVDAVTRVEAEAVPGRTALSEAVMRNYFRLMAYKDEYEVARLYSNGQFRKNLESQFEGDYTLAFNLAPPLITRRDPDTGRMKKREFGPWMMRGFELLAKLKGLRGSAFDIFGYSAERKMERQLIEDYRDTITGLLARLNADNYDIAVQLASQPAEIRGFGHVKEEAVDKARVEKELLLQSFGRAGSAIATDGGVRYQETG
jgi:indolepyruvate ferredoxin oxidoreductase